MSKCVQLDHVSKVYIGKKSSTEALKDITFEVYNESFTVIVGQSGCGKSTLLKIIAGLIPKTDGTVIVNDNEVTGPQPNIGMVFQSPVLLKWRKVIDNVLLPIEILRLDRKEFEKKAYELIELVGLKGFEVKYPNELSGGMQQRVSICRALIHDPPLLLMDEPFGALDALTRDELNLELLRIWSETKKTILFVTHSIPESVFLADNVIVLTPRPATVCEIIRIDLPRPRTADLKYTKEFGDYCHLIQKCVAVRSPSSPSEQSFL